MPAREHEQQQPPSPRLLQSTGTTQDVSKSKKLRQVVPADDAARRSDAGSPASAANAYTMVPNFIIDEFLSQLPAAEFQVLIYLIRRTIGFQRTSDTISISQFLQGNKRDGGCGVKNRQTLLRAISGLEARGLITATRQSNPMQGNTPTLYTVHLRRDPGNILQPRGEGHAPGASHILQPRGPQYGAGPHTPPGNILQPRGQSCFETKALVTKHDTQKKEHETKNMKSNNRTMDPVMPASFVVVASSESLNETGDNSPATPKQASTKEGADAADAIFGRLIVAGVTRTTAYTLLSTHPLEQIRQQLEALPFRRAEEPAAVLVRSIQQDWALPKKSTTHNQTKQQTAATSYKASENKQLEIERRQQRERVAAFMAGLHEQERSSIEAEATARMQEECGKTLDRASSAVAAQIYSAILSEVVSEKMSVAARK